MKAISIITICLILLAGNVCAQGYKVGDKAIDFNLKNVDGKFVSMRNYPQAKGIVVIFTCNHCPYAKAYQQRVIDIDKKYKTLGYPVIAINPNDPEIEPEDSFANMVKVAKDKGFTFPYLFDEGQDIYRTYGAKRTPHAFLLQRQGDAFIVKYIGAIDDNTYDASNVTKSFLGDAIDSLLAGKDPDPSFTKAIGCSIKDAKASNP